MAANTLLAGIGRRHGIALTISFSARIGSTINTAQKTLQMARMLSALSNMNDHQLAQIGISRSEIPEYAEKLMANEQRS